MVIKAIKRGRVIINDKGKYLCIDKGRAEETTNLCEATVFSVFSDFEDIQKGWMFPGEVKDILVQYQVY